MKNIRNERRIRPPVVLCWCLDLDLGTCAAVKGWPKTGEQTYLTYLRKFNIGMLTRIRVFVGVSGV